MAAKRLGEYELVRELGRGGMGVVYEARDLALDRTVALKILPRKLAVDASYVTRFLNEARAAARLNHPNIVIVHAVGEADGRRYIAMERVRGRVLSKFVKTGRPMPAGQALNLTRQVADALAAAHSQGIVHRDIKPQNIMVDEAGAVKVLDFGLARLQGSGAGLTTTGAQLGTPRYMSPEQAQGKKADERSDIYSLGVVLYELLAGRAAYDGDSPVAVMYQIVHEPFPPLATATLGVPPPVAALVAKMVAKRPEDRYASSTALLEEIDAMLAGGIPVRAPVASAGTGEAAPSLVLDDDLRSEIVGQALGPPARRPRSPFEIPFGQDVPWRQLVQGVGVVLGIGVLGALVLIAVVATTRPRTAVEDEFVLRPADFSSIGPGSYSTTRTTSNEGEYECVYEFRDWVDPSARTGRILLVERNYTGEYPGYWEFRGNGVFSYSKVDDSVPRWVFPLPLREGMEWDTVQYSPLGTTPQRNKTFHADHVETISVPAGRFRAIHVDIKNPDNADHEEFWFARGVGFVKWKYTYLTRDGSFESTLHELKTASWLR